MAEQQAVNLWVVGSIPARRDTLMYISLLLLVKVQSFHLLLIIVKRFKEFTLYNNMEG